MTNIFAVGIPHLEIKSNVICWEHEWDSSFYTFFNNLYLPLICRFNAIWMEVCVLNYGKFVSIRTNNGYNDLRLFMNSFSLHNINVIIAKCNLSNWENLFAIYLCFVNENMKSLFCNCARYVLCYFYHFLLFFCVLCLRIRIGNNIRIDFSI